VPRVHLLALRVRELGAAREALARERARTLREDPELDCFLTHPSDTQGCLIAWSARELPGDSRATTA
jgi:hypothetical protein